MPAVATSLDRPCLRNLSLGSDLLRRLESLAIAAGRIFATGGVASRPGAVRGGRIEFLDHRGYVAGDDLRDLDWPLYGRTDELFVKIYGAEREKRVEILLDLSPSMTVTESKELFACRLAAALAHVALAAGDSVAVAAASPAAADPGASSLRPRKGLRASREIVSWLERLPASGAVDWPAWAARLRAGPRAPGAMIILSDFWTEGAVEALLPLVKGRQEVTLLRVLTPEELSPPYDGNVRLADAETGEEVSLRLSPGDLDAYRAEVENRIQSLAARARRHGMRHLLCRTDTPFEAAVLTYLRRGGLLR